MHRGLIRLPRGPVQSITSATDANGTIPSTSYTLERFGLTDYWKLLTSNPTYPITITYSAGYGSQSDVPADLRQIMLGHLAFLYDNRNASSDAAPALDRVYRQYRSYAQ